MTISSTQNRNNYIGDGNTSVYPYAFKIFANTDLKVVVRDLLGAETVLAINTDYTVSGVGLTAGGNVTLVSSGQAWLTGNNLTLNYGLAIRRVRPITQTTDIANQGSYFPRTQENALDHEIMVDQQQQDQIDRSVKLPETVIASTFNPTLPALLSANPGATIMVNAAGNGWDLGATTTALARLGVVGTYAALKALAAADPTHIYFGWATDIFQWVAYTTDVTVGDGGWTVWGG